MKLFNYYPLDTFRKFARTTLLLCLIIANGGCNKSDSSGYQGYVEGEYIYVSAPLAGTLVTLSVDRGNQVKVGDPIFVLDSIQQKAALDQARAALEFSEQELLRQDKLLRVLNATAMQELERARSNRNQDKERVTQAEWNYNQMTQAAPQEGVIFDIFYRLGEWVPAGRPVVALLPPRQVKIRAFVPEGDIGRIHLNDTAHFKVDGVSPDQACRVRFISPRAEYTPPVIYSERMRSKLIFMIELSVDPEIARKLNPGQPVDVFF